MIKIQRHKRKILGVIFTIFMIFISFGTLSWLIELSRGPIQSPYKSPEGGEVLEIGEWAYGEFHSPTSSEPLGVVIRIEVIDWGNAPSELRFVFGCNAMSLSEFLTLTDSEIYSELHCHNTTKSSDSPGTAFGMGFGLTEDLDYVWVFRFLDLDGHVVPGSLKIIITVEIDVSH